MELFKTLKFHIPISLFDLFTFSSRGVKPMIILLPQINLDTTKRNFVFSSSVIWNKLLDKIFNKCTAQPDGVVIPGSALNSDLAASSGVIKKKLKLLLLSEQKRGDEIEWL